MPDSRRRALCIGCRGGVGRALCALLTRRPDLLDEIPSELLLLDARTEPEFIHPPWARVLPPRHLNADGLAALLRELDVQQLIDCSTMDTATALTAAASAGTDYLSTSIETAAEMPTHLAIERLYTEAPAARDSFLVASGMNPGIVNALSFVGMEAFAARVGVDPRALELQSLLITEHDSTQSDNGVERDASVLALPWQPETALKELCEPEAFCWRRGVSGMGHPPWAALYRARCGDRHIEGLLVPHEEVFTLGARLGISEAAFIYRLPEAAQHRLSNGPRRFSWRLRRLGPPDQTRLRGADRVGVLLVSKRYGELWIGFDTPVDAGLPFDTNATLLQVAVGVIAGWNQLGRVTGLHFPEDLDCHQYVHTASSVLGEPLIVHDPTALPCTISERRVAER